MQLTLKELITQLESLDQDKVISYGFGSPMSYRGYYDELAFEPEENVTVSHMLENALSALGKTFEGYKGGDFTMRENTPCWIAHYGNTGDEINDTLLSYWSK